MTDRDDFLGEIDKAQRTVLAGAALEFHYLMGGTGWLDYVSADDSTLAAQKVLEEANHHLFRALSGYTDWAATTIIRSRRFGRRRLPVPEGQAVEQIAQNNDTTPHFVHYIIMLLHARNSTNVPVLGRVKNGALTPNKKQLKLWEACYDWSKGGRAPSDEIPVTSRSPGM